MMSKAMVGHGDGKSQLPLTGVVLCCTSIPPERRSELIAFASEMGASHCLDLTIDVTHLIVGSTATSKYRYVAKERSDVSVMLPSWVEAVRDQWLEGGDVDLDALAAAHRCPVLWGTKVCLTGFTEIPERKHIEKTVEANGGTYAGDLTKDVTHLIAYEPKGMKYQYAWQWGIHRVAIEWLYQSLDRGLILDESLFDPVMPEHERGKGAWNRREAEEVKRAQGKRGREDGGESLGARKLRRTASKRFESQNENIWEDIVSGKSERPEVRREEWDEDLVPIERPQRRESEAENPQPQRKGIQKRTGIFSGKKFFLHGFNAKQIGVLEKHLKSQDAEVVQERDQFTQEATSESHLLLVPYTISKRELPSWFDENAHTAVTEFWIEKCIASKDFVKPGASPPYSPFNSPVQGFDQLTIASTGFEDVDLLHIGKTIRQLGANYEGTLRKTVSVLVCHSNISPDREKVHFALKWGVPAVRAKWLWDSMRDGAKRSFADYLLHDSQRADLEQSKAHKGTKPKKRLFEEFPVKEAAAAGHAKQAAKKPNEPHRRHLQVRRSESFAVEDSMEKNPQSIDESFAREGVDDSMTLPADDDDGIRPPSPTHGPGSLRPLNERAINSQPNASKSPSPTKSFIQHIDPAKPPLPPTSPRRSPAKSPTSASAPPLAQTLASAISSCLASRRNRAGGPPRPGTPTSASPSKTESTPGARRRRRQLLGRAPSSSSIGAATGGGGGVGAPRGLSRTSSVASLNTDGVGTPLELVGSGLLGGAAPAVADPLLGGDEGDEEQAAAAVSQEAPAATQVGYEDEAGEGWRRGLAERMGWDAEELAPTRGVKRKSSEVAGGSGAGMGMERPVKALRRSENELNARRAGLRKRGVH